MNRTELEDARLVLSEHLLRLWEQADLIDKLFLDGKPTGTAKGLLRDMGGTVDAMGRHIKTLIETADLKED